MKRKPYLVALVMVALMGNAWSELYVAESFTGTSADDWTFTAGQGQGASLTAGSGLDADGDGWLRLTQSLNSQSSFVYHNQAIPTQNGLVFEFDFVVWGDGSTLADGFTLAIFDATATPMAGGYGGARWGMPSIPVKAVSA